MPRFKREKAVLKRMNDDHRRAESKYTASILRMCRKEFLKGRRQRSGSILPIHQDHNSLFHLAVTEDKLLGCPSRGMMQFIRTLYHAKAYAKLIVQRFRVVTNYIQTTAFHRAFRTKGAHNHVAACPDGPSDLVNIRITILARSKKVKHCAIMPNVVRARLQRGACHVGYEPVDPFSDLAQTPFANVDGGFRNIKNSKVLARIVG